MALPACAGFSGEIKPLAWKQGTTNVLESLPVRDSVLAIADETYFDWPVLPEAPSGLAVRTSAGAAELSWELHGGDITAVAVERRIGDHGKWERAAKLAANAKSYRDSTNSQMVCYRVRALNGAGESAYSNVVRVTR